MRRKAVYSVLIAMAVALWAGTAAVVRAEVEWDLVDNIELHDTPLDVVMSADGETAFILCPNNIKVYSTRAKKVTDTIPVEGRFTQLTLSPDGETLWLAEAEKKRLAIIRVTRIWDLQIGQSPVIGDPQAPVSLVVFTDYQ